MNKKNSGGDGAGKKSAMETSIDEVEELLKLTQDDLLLKLTVNSHLTSKPKPKPKSKPNSNFIPDSSSSSSSIIDTDLDRRFQALRSTKPETQNVDDLFTRFAALKGGANATPAVDSNYGIGDNDEEDEVQKIINWAVDAARLDPSPSSDIDENDDSDSDNEKDSDSDSDSDNDEFVRKVDCKKKGSKKYDVASKVDCKKKGSKK